VLFEYGHLSFRFYGNVFKNQYIYLFIFYRLTNCDRDYMVMSVLPRLLDAAVSVDLHSSHGATLATGQIVLALAPEETQGSGEGKQTSAAQVLGKADLFTRVEELVDRLVAGRRKIKIFI
jgi:hypothetical protein